MPGSPTTEKAERPRRPARPVTDDQILLDMADADRQFAECHRNVLEDGQERRLFVKFKPNGRVYVERLAVETNAT